MTKYIVEDAETVGVDAGGDTKWFLIQGEIDE